MKNFMIAVCCAVLLSAPSAFADDSFVTTTENSDSSGSSLVVGPYGSVSTTQGPGGQTGTRTVVSRPISGAELAERYRSSASYDDEMDEAPEKTNPFSL